jgi:hypothetical protein
MKAIIPVLFALLMTSAKAQHHGDLIPAGCSHVVKNFWPMPPHGDLVFVERHVTLMCSQGEVYICTFYSKVYERNMNIVVDRSVWSYGRRGEVFFVQ